MMKERGILFSGGMVRAILTGTKTQTRRIASKNVRHPDLGNLYAPGALVLEHEPQHVIDRCCPYGQPGDRLWVRETTIKVEDHGYVGPVYVESEEGMAVLDYGLAPSPDDMAEVEPFDIRKRPAIHMPRSMSRITLEITAVRVERLNDISEADAKAEGADCLDTATCTAEERALLAFPLMDDATPYRNGYALLWESINGPGSWAANPWVWVVEFKRMKGGA